MLRKIQMAVWGACCEANGYDIEREQRLREGTVAMELAEFIALHGAALEANEARHNLILGLLEHAKDEADHGYLLWSLDAPGACALKTPGPGRNIILGELTQAQCAELARITAGVDYPGVIGPDDAPRWFVAAAEALGIGFQAEAHAHRIHALSRPPSRPAVPGTARLATMDDADLVFAWIGAFRDEATPEDGPPLRAYTDAAILEGCLWLWQVDGAAVSMAGLGRRLKHCVSIGAVYTPPEHRMRGYGGAVTAAVADAIFAGGCATACLYTDLSNPYSNRCYAKLGFTPVCDSWVYRRV
jgi:ribosomal protein S18 acetylase RimI-like enzyme